MSKQLKLLAIYGDFEIIDYQKIILEPNDYEITTTSSCSRGIQLAQRINPDIIILDLPRLDTDGINFCVEVRKYSSVPILVISAVNKPEIIAQMLDAGADDYLVKPVSKNLLDACLRQLTRRARAEQEALRSNDYYHMI